MCRSFVWSSASASARDQHRHRFSVILIRYFSCLFFSHFVSYILFAATAACVSETVSQHSATARMIEKRWENLSGCIMQITNYKTHSKFNDNKIFLSIFFSFHVSCVVARGDLYAIFPTHLCGPRDGVVVIVVCIPIGLPARIRWVCFMPMAMKNCSN